MCEAKTKLPGDTHLLHAARTQARDGFDKHRSLEASSKEATDGISHAEGVAEVLKHNIVQGKQVDSSDTLSTWRKRDRPIHMGKR